MNALRTRPFGVWPVICASLVLLMMGGVTSVAVPRASGASGTAPGTSAAYHPAAIGELDCNGDSPVQKPVKASMPCTDIRGIAGLDNANVWNSRFYDNNVYIGHDEPDLSFLSNSPGSGNNVTWTETLGSDPAASPTVGTPGSDVSHWFELSVAPWFSMAMCDSNSYPQSTCTPESDSNAPSATSNGGGSAFMEMQFYPPGFAPFSDSISCDNSHWCAALTIDSLECTEGFVTCNANCEEPVNFAFIQTDGVPAGPPSPQMADLATYTPNSHTLLMNPGDTVKVHMANAPVRGSGRAFEVVVDDVTTGQSGYMQASAANGFQNTSIADCSGTPFNFQPEYSTASSGNYIPWAALETDISIEFETGHFTPCTSVSSPYTISLSATVTDTFYNTCTGPYEGGPKDGTGTNRAEAGDGLCYPHGDTHYLQATAPDTVTGCLDDIFQNGDLDFDGTPYWPEWPTGASSTALHPSSFVQQFPTTSGDHYQQMFMQSDVALSESTCSATTTRGCSIPPKSPGGFYPYWSTVQGSGSSCVIEFGNVSSGRGVSDYGGVSQYGTDQIATLGYPEYVVPTRAAGCA